MEKNLSLNRETMHIFWNGILASNPRRRLATTALFPLGALLLTVAVPYYIGRIVASLNNPAIDPYHYAPHLIIVSVLGIICNRIGFQAVLTMQANTMAYLQKISFETLLRRSVGFHNNNVGGKLVSDAIDFPAAFSQLSDAAITNLAPFLLVLAVGATVVVIESWQLGLVVAIMVGYAVGSGVYQSRRRTSVRLRRLVAGKAVTGHLADAIVNVMTVKIFAHEPRELESHRSLSQRLTDLRIKDWTSAAREGNTRIVVLLIMQLAFVYTLVWLARSNPDILHVGIFAFSFITMMSVRLFQINIMLRQIEDGFLNASPMTEILLQQPEIKDAPHAHQLKVPQGAIDFQSVGFRYADAGQANQVFSKLILSIKPGEKVGLVGPSGGGKSTLTRLLLRFEDIEDGKILIDDQDISKVTQESLRQAVSYVPQEPLLFHRTVAENIAYGHQDATFADIKRAAKLAHADDFIEALPDTYDTIVGERGVKLSGGQRQRIAIARAILKDAPILVLDEATSALDSESEVYIQDALWQLMQNRTAIVIAHRLSTIQKMDRIVVLEDGKITEHGTHRQLLKNKGTYAKLWSHQSGGFIED